MFTRVHQDDECLCEHYMSWIYIFSSTTVRNSYLSLDLLCSHEFIRMMSVCVNISMQMLLRYWQTKLQKIRHFLYSFSFRIWNLRLILQVEISIQMMMTHLLNLKVKLLVHRHMLTVTLMSAILKVRVCYSKVLRSFFSAFVDCLQRPFPTIYLSASNNSRNAGFVWALIMESFLKNIEPHFLFKLESVTDRFMRSPPMFLPAFLICH